MSVRVHELAKELKISTGALQKHLKDLGIAVKSHMSHLEESDAGRVRGLFQQERDINKKREEERKRYQAARIKEKQEQMERELTARKKVKALAKEKAEKQALAKEEQESTITPPEEKRTTPTFIEKPIEKSTQSEDNLQRNRLNVSTKKSDEISLVENTEEIEEIAEPQDTVTNIEDNRPKSTKSQKAPLAPLPDLPEPPIITDKVAIKKKMISSAGKVVTSEDNEAKIKHMQAKIKHTKKGKKKKTVEPFPVEEAEVKRNIKQTMSKQKKKKYKKEDKTISEHENDSPEIIISEFTSVAELAKIMDIPATDIIMKFFKMGKNTTINQRLDKDSLEMICHEFDFDVNFASEYGTEMLNIVSEKNKDAKDFPRPPIVTVMGHVDHGKTSILDCIRSSNVAGGEEGKITQHIGASQIIHNGKKITFLDTPGHEAFAAMRARGSQVTDIAILVVAADDGVKPQTVEAIDHAKASGVEIVVAINKIDLKTANIDRVISDLSKHNIFLENYGGNVVWVTCSATTGQGIDDLLEVILLVAEMKDLKAKKEVPGVAVVIEAKKDSQKGTMATLLVREGKLEKGDAVVCGATYGKIRMMEDAKGNRIKELHPSDVAVIYGLNDVPKEGDFLNKVDTEKIAKQISTERKTTRHERERFINRTNLGNLFMKIKQKDIADIRLIVKGDTDGSVEAFCDAIQKLSNDEVQVNVIHKSVGTIVEADVNLAIASDALIIGFHVRAENKAKKLAEDNHVEIKTYQIIYDGINEIKSSLEGMIEPDYEDKFVGSAIVKQLFKVKSIGVIAGCAVDKGKIVKEGIARIYRNTGMIHQGKIHSLKHFAADAEEVKAGSECGIGIHNFNDVKEGDIIEVYVTEAVPRTLSAN